MESEAHVMQSKGAPNREALAATLAWWRDAGVDTLVQAEPRRWLDETRPPAAAPARPRPAEPPPELEAASEPVSAGAGDAAPLAAAAADLAALRQAVEGFEACALRAPGRKCVFADGNPEADLMLIGEAPGAAEDHQGLPFVGPAGQLLDRMLAAIGRDRASAYISNVAFWRPPGNRVPSPAEVASCLPFVHRHIALVRPKAIMALGATAARALTGSSAGINRMRGSWRTLSIEGRDYPLLPSFHPAFLLRQPECKRQAWADLLSLKAKLDAADAD